MRLALLIIGVIILLGVLGFEVLFIFRTYSQPTGKVANQSQPELPSPTGIIMSISPVAQQKQVIISTVDSLVKNAQLADLQLEYRGHVLTILDEGVDTEGRKFKKKLEVIDSNQQTTIVYLYEDILDNVNISDRIGEKDVPIKLEDIKVGDMVLIKESLDLTTNFPYDLTSMSIVRTSK